MNDLCIIAEMKATALGEAKRATNGNTGLARALGGEISPQAIAQWKHVPADRVLKVEKVSGVSRHRLRPDLYPEDAA
jgi:DNA-binding transcriptional regulator YdaS (Cro superfamily)